MTGDQALTVLAEVAPENRVNWLTKLPVKLLREMADLQGASDAEYMGKKSAIIAIVDNF